MIKEATNASRQLYAIYDKKAQDIIGNFIHVMRHEAVAVRMFADAIGDARTGFRNHPEDYALVRLGYITDDGIDLVPVYEQVIEASTIVAAQAAAQEGGN